MLIDLGDKVEYEVKFAGQTYKLREPTAKDVQAMNKRREGGDEFESLMEFLVDLGLPGEVCRDLGISKIKILTDRLTEELGEKK